VNQPKVGWRSDATIVLSPSFTRIAFPHSFPELPPSFFLDLLFPWLEGELADALDELV
jgi:hypothetical protein